MKPTTNDIIETGNRPRGKYSGQFWLIFWGQLISVGGTSITWPFLTIYLREQLGLPLATITTLITLESAMTVLATIIVGPFMDRYGRRWVMIFSLFMNCVTFLLMSQASSLLEFAILMGVRGLFTPLFRVGTNTMVTDLTSEKDRYDAFSLSRTSANIGFAIGPAIGGFIAAVSFQLSLYISASIMGIMTLLTLLLLKETLPNEVKRQPKSARQEFIGYKRIFNDKIFLYFLLGDTFVMMAMVNMFNLLSVYSKENFGMPESQYGFIMTVNAVMAASLQYPVTQFTKRYPVALMLAIGAVFYAFGLGSVAFGNRFLHFALSMVIMTCGELILMPMAMSLVSRLAPLELRGSYMGIYSLTMGAARGIGPLIGGVLNDQIAPAAIWYGGFVLGLISAGLFLLLDKKIRREEQPAITCSG